MTGTRLPSLADVLPERARDHPNRVALRAGDDAWTYAALLEEVRSRSAVLAELALPAGAGVALPAERTAATVINILAVVDAGLSWIPLNEELPAARRDFVLADSGAAVLVASGAELALTVLPAAPNPLRNDAAYVIYTSGSTGDPKGVEVSRSNLESLLRWSTAEFDHRPDDVFSMLHSPAFDYSVWEMWNALAAGACLVVADGPTVHNAGRLLAFIEDAGVTVLHLVPSVLRRLVDAADRGSGRVPVCRYLVTGGEAFDLAAARAWCSMAPAGATTVVNMYGPTECTIVATYEEIDVVGADDVRWQSIGRAVPGTSMRIAGADGAFVPDGELGELWLSSDRVATGYVNRPELTRERFVPLQDGSDPARYYRTGDVVRYGPDGRLEFAGREDDQAKINGHRVEIGEVEQAVRSLDGVADCAVGVFDDVRGARRLGALVVLEAGVDLSGVEIRARLVGHLALAVVPVRIVVTASLPLSASSKVDRREVARLLASEPVPRRLENPRG